MEDQKKKTIKIKYDGLLPGWEWNDTHNFISKILSRRYELVFSENPDFLICSCFGLYPYTKYDCPRIYYSGEALIPDFNLVDYAISYDPIEFGDRHFYYPACIHQHKNPDKIKKRVIEAHDRTLLQSKEYFCNFVYSNQRGDCRIRDAFFHELCNKYKKVTSAGRHLNNMPSGKNLPPDGKFDFQRKCKFSIAFENQRLSGYCTEKIIDAFNAKTIPIYYGDPLVKTIFNPKAFINVPDYDNWDDVIEEIRRLDNDDEAYMKMLSEPIFIDPEYPSRRYRELCDFIYHIFDQEPEQAYRRSRVMFAERHNDRMRFLQTVIGRIGYKIYIAFKLLLKSGIREVIREIKKY